MRWTDCETCSAPVALDRLSLISHYRQSYPASADWKIACPDCACSDAAPYWISPCDLYEKIHTHTMGDRVVRVIGLDAWIEHLSEKEWFNERNFRSAVARLDDISRRARPNRRSPLSLALRFAILQRDHFRCVYCGARGVELHVDHAVSVADGGSDDPSNLVTACVPCNLGKGRRSVRLEVERPPDA